MTRSFRIVSTGNLQTIYTHANKTCNSEIKTAIDESLKTTVSMARAIAPVYDPLKWPLWAIYEHHNIPPGTLKLSIYSTTPVCHGRGKAFSARYGAKATFASHIENGFWHRKAKRKIPGKHFMETTLDVVGKAALHYEINSAVRRMLLVGP